MPQSDPQISKMVEEAERITDREKRAAEKEERRNAPKPVPAIDIESLRAYRALYPHPPTAVWMFGLLTALAGFFASLLEHIFTNDRLIFGGISVLFILYGFLKGSIVPIFWYLFHHNWRKQLPFTLNGWQEFGSNGNILHSWNWRDLSIKIDASTTSPEFTTALNAIMTILCKDAANVFYKEDVGEPTRHVLAWDAKKRALTGSVNSQTLGLLLDFFRGPMSQVVKSYNARATVTIAGDGEWYHVTGKPMGQTVMG